MDYRRVGALGMASLALSGVLFSASTIGAGAEETPDSGTDIVIPVPTVTVSVPGPTITLPGQTITVPPIVTTIRPPAVEIPFPVFITNFVQLPRATSTVTETERIRVPGPTITNRVVRTATATATVTRQITPPSASIGPADTPIDPEGETRTKTETIIRKVAIGTAIGLAAAALGMLGFFLAYGLGYKDSQRSEDKFIAGLLGLGPHVPRHKR